MATEYEMRGLRSVAYTIDITTENLLCSKDEPTRRALVRGLRDFLHDRKSALTRYLGPIGKLL